MKIIFIAILIILSACADNKEKINDAAYKNRKVEEIEIVAETVLGESSTKIIDKGSNRLSNIALACAKINGKEILTGEEFSFNKITEKKTKANGYKNAPVIVDGEKSYGLGGGVCQVSTTIYMAALNAGLKINEHHNHSEAVAYAPKGMDSTVVYGVKDLKFVNNTENTVTIYVWSNNENVFAKIVKRSL